MARELDIGDVVAITATVRKRIGDRVSLAIPGYNFPHSIVDPKAKPGDRIRLECEVARIDEEDGKVTVRGDVSITIDIRAVDLVRKAPTPRLRDKAD